jgi:hypothetical protein
MTGARPEIINMVDWAGSGEVVGCWVHIGPCWLDGNEDKKMMSDYAPMNFKNRVISTCFAKKYWKIHLPRSKKRMSFHRQLLRDFHGSKLDGFDVHHRDRNKYNNCLANLQRRVASRHRSDAGRDGGRGNKKDGSGMKCKTKCVCACTWP